jgi:hypothetical protein
MSGGSFARGYLLSAKTGKGARISLEAAFDLVPIYDNAAVEISTLRAFGVANGTMIHAWCMPASVPGRWLRHLQEFLVVLILVPSLRATRLAGLWTRNTLA